MCPFAHARNASSEIHPVFISRVLFTELKERFDMTSRRTEIRFDDSSREKKTHDAQRNIRKVIVVCEESERDRAHHLLYRRTSYISQVARLTK